MKLEYKEVMYKIFLMLKKASLSFNLKKYLFNIKKVTYLGYVVKVGVGILYNLEKL